MGKSAGTTRSSSSGSPRGLSNMPNPVEYRSQPVATEAMERLAETLRRERRLNVDIDDALYEEARNLGPSSVEFAIDMSTDYNSQVNNRGEIIIQSQYTSEADAIRDYGTERVVIPMENRSLIDIIQELRTSNESTIFRKYR